MADWLLIRFSNDSDNVGYLTADAAGRIVTAPRTGPVSALAQQAAGRRICVLVPASDVLLTDAEVPIKSGNRTQQIVPYVLEEQVAQDIDSLHFAVGRRVGEAARIPVAVVSRALVDDWLEKLHGAGLEPECLYADSSLTPENPGQAVLVLSGDSVMLRGAGMQSVTLPLTALAEALERTLAVGIGADLEALLLQGHRDARQDIAVVIHQGDGLLHLPIPFSRYINVWGHEANAIWR